MGKVKFGINDAVDAEPEGFKEYNGPTPPGKKPYRGFIKRIELKENGNKDPMLKFLIELKATPGTENEKYDGYGVWDQQNVTDQGKGYVNAMLDAMTDGSDAAKRELRRAFWGGELVVDGDGYGHITRIGKMKVNSPDSCNIPVAFMGKTHTYNNETSLRVGRWLVEKKQEVVHEELEELPEDLEEELGLPDAETEAYDEVTGNGNFPEEEATDDTDEDTEPDGALF